MSGRETAPSSTAWTCASGSSSAVRCGGLEEPRVASRPRGSTAGRRARARGSSASSSIHDRMRGAAASCGQRSALALTRIAHRRPRRGPGSRSRSSCAARRGSRSPSSTAAPRARSPTPARPSGALAPPCGSTGLPATHTTASHQVRPVGADVHRAVRRRRPSPTITAGAVARLLDQGREVLRVGLDRRTGPARVERPIPRGS